MMGFSTAADYESQSDESEERAVVKAKEID